MAGSLFDKLQKSTFDTTLAVFGYDAIWQPAGGGPAQTGKVHFGSATDEENLAGPAGYTEPQWVMEYMAGQFTGLFESVNAAQVVERVTIDGTSYDVRSCTTEVDGKTIICQLNPTP